MRTCWCMYVYFYQINKKIFWCTYLCTLTAFFSFVWNNAYAQYSATTSVSLTVCGDAIVAGPEICDDGTNTGAYALSIITRNCDPLCRGYGPYCGDGISQFSLGERCDDSNNIAGDLCSPTCQDESPPVIVGGGGTGGGTSGGGGGRSGGTGQDGISGAVTDGGIEFEGVTDVVIRGSAYPGATITVLRDGDIERVIEADGTSNFEFRLTGQTPGITTFGLWALDKASRRSITYSTTFQIVQNAITTLSGILIPPTLEVEPEKVSPGESTTFQGTAAPNARVETYVDISQDPDVTIASQNGEYTISHNTTSLTAEQFHTVRALYLLPESDLKSGYSSLVSYYVGTGDASDTINADLNRDGYVNLTDFSILLFNWNTSGGIADINKDGTVNLADFSIMLFYWTG